MMILVIWSLTLHLVLFLPNNKLLFWGNNLYYNQNSSIVQVASQLSVDSKPTLITGSYTGNNNSRWMSLSINANIVFVCCTKTIMGDDNSGAIFYQGASITFEREGTYSGTSSYIQDNKIYFNNGYMNESNRVYKYVAIG